MSVSRSAAIEAALDPVFLREWDACHEAARDAVVAALRAMGARPETLEYASGLRLYYRVIYLLTLWAPDADLRRRITIDLAAHVVSMKLIDDLNDDDSGMDRLDLGLGFLTLLLSSTHKLAAYGDAIGVLAAQAENFEHICREQLRCKRVPARDLGTWLDYANEYGARFLATYGRMGGLASGLGAASEVPETFASAFGLIITIADDLTDYFRKHERIGNIGALILDGAVTSADLARVLDRERTRARDAAEALPTAYDLRPMVDIYVYDVLDRIIPMILAEKTTTAER